MSTKEDPTCPIGDVLTIGARDANGEIPCIRHKADHTVQLGRVQLLEDGKPIDPNAEIVTLEHISGGDYRITDSTESKGPAKVSSNAYRHGWDAIFGKKQPVGQA